jgi:UDP-N-acetylglucosamine--N-acetylmuramyl-(pentapeptide) pyrophosphoryl-undecaprenol N-acetylglucosamine transferase
VPPDDIDGSRRYAELGIPAELMTYIEDMPASSPRRIWSSAARASTHAELTAPGGRRS